MRREQLSKYKGDLVSVYNNERVACLDVDEKSYLNRALSSANPAARASTAKGVPIFRSANMARYRSKSGSSLLRSFDRRSLMLDSVTSSGLGTPVIRPDVGGAGSIDRYVLDLICF